MQTRNRLMRGFDLVMVRSNRNDKHTGEFDPSVCRDCEPLSPERIAAAEKRKTRAKAEELAKAGRMCNPR